MGALKSDHCSRGHLMEGDNLYFRKDGTRECRLCSLVRAETQRRNKQIPARKPPDGITTGPPEPGYAPRRRAEKTAERRYVPLED